MALKARQRALYGTVIVLLAVIAVLIVHGEGHRVSSRGLASRASNPTSIPVTTTVPTGGLLALPASPGVDGACKLPRDYLPSPAVSTPISQLASGSDSERSYPASEGTAGGILASSSAVGVFVVVGQDAAYQRAASSSIEALVGGRPNDPVTVTLPPSGPRVISRTTRLQLTKSVKGSFPACLTIDIPGGVANGQSYVDSAFPITVNNGDHLVVTFGAYQNGTLFPTEVGEVAPDGSTALHLVPINVNNWVG